MASEVRINVTADSGESPLIIARTAKSLWARVRINHTNRMSSGIDAANQRAGRSFGGLNRQLISTRAMFGPMSLAVNQLSLSLSDVSGPAGVASRALGQFGVHVAGSAASLGGMNGLLLAARAALNPWILAITAGTSFDTFLNPQALLGPRSLRSANCIETLIMKSRKHFGSSAVTVLDRVYEGWTATSRSWRYPA